MQKKKATGTKTAAGSRSMKRILDTGVEVCDNRVKKNQRHTANKKPNMYKDIYKKNQYFGLAYHTYVTLGTEIFLRSL